MKRLLSLTLLPLLCASLLNAHDDHPSIQLLNNSSLIHRDMASMNPGDNLKDVKLGDLQGQCVVKINGLYHMYFAKHKGLKIYLATSPDLASNEWTYVGIVLDDTVGEGLANFDHIAAPDVRVAEDDSGRYIMLFHGQHRLGKGATKKKGKKEHLNYMAVSDDPTNFNDGVLLQERLGTMAPVCIAGPYARAFKMGEDYYAVSKKGALYDIPEQFEAVFKAGTYDSIDRSSLSNKLDKPNFTPIPSPINEDLLLHAWGLEPKQYNWINHNHMAQIRDSNEAEFFFWIKKPTDRKYFDLYRQVIELSSDGSWSIDPAHKPKAIVTREAVSQTVGQKVSSIGDPYLFYEGDQKYLFFGYSHGGADSQGEGNIGIGKLSH